MSKSFTLCALVASVIPGVLRAQDTGAGIRGEMRGGFETWLSELEEAYKAHNPDRIGQLIKDMKEGSPQRGPERGRSGGAPEGPNGQGRRMRRPGQATADSKGFPNTLMANSDSEERTLAVLDELERTKQRENMNIPLADGRLLRLLTEAIDAKHVVEVGTSNGYSGIWLGLALGNTGGKLTTFELDAQRASLARENFKRAGTDTIVTLVEGDAHKNVMQITEPIDLLFLDADKEGYADYLNKLLPLVRTGGLVVAHNIDRGRGDITKYIEAITTNPALESLLVNGRVSITLKKR